jgi:hypothetical protein
MTEREGEMEFKRGGFVAHVAYEHILFSSCRPTRTTLCSLFWRFWFGLLVGWPATLFTMFMLYGAGNAVAFIWAQRIPMFPGDDSKVSVPIRHWPTVRGHRLKPWWLLVAWALWAVVSKAMSVMDGIDFCLVVAFTLVALGLGALLLLIVSGLQIGRETIHESEVIKLVFERVKAFKTKICPVVDFV